MQNFSDNEKNPVKTASPVGHYVFPRDTCHGFAFALRFVLCPRLSYFAFFSTYLDTSKAKIATKWSFWYGLFPKVNRAIAWHCWNVQHVHGAHGRTQLKSTHHWGHDVVATLNQHYWRWFNLATTSCAQCDRVGLVNKITETQNKCNCHL